MLEVTLAAGVQNWCLDYKQNVVDQRLEGNTWMMAVSEAGLLQELHEYLLDEIDAHAATQERREEALIAQRASAAAAAVRPSRRQREDGEPRAGTRTAGAASVKESPAKRSTSRA